MDAGHGSSESTHHVSDADRSTLSMSLLMTPGMANFTGNVHGGTLLKLLDEVAYACASRYSRRYAVTLSVDRVIFREPIRVGELLILSASINYTGRTSMEVGIRVETHYVHKPPKDDLYHSVSVFGLGEESMGSVSAIRLV